MLAPWLRLLGDAKVEEQAESDKLGAGEEEGSRPGHERSASVSSLLHQRKRQGVYIFSAPSPSSTCSARLPLAQHRF